VNEEKTKPSELDLFNQAKAEGQAEVTTAPVPWPLTPERVREFCTSRERILRAGFKDHVLPSDMERELARFPLDDDDSAWRRYQLLLQFGAERDRRSMEAEDEKRTAAHLLTTSEPVPVRIAGRVIGVTTRSWSQMTTLFRHEESLQLVGEALDRLQARVDELRARRDLREIQWVDYWRERMEIWHLRRAAEDDWTLHMRAIVANAVAHDGTAKGPEDAPEWWNEIGEDEVRLLVGIFEAGHRRMLRMRGPEKPNQLLEEDRRDDWGWSGLLRAIEARFRLPPMSLDNAPFFPLLAALEMGAAQGAADAEVEDVFAA
jgi:hypothetical protein